MVFLSKKKKNYLFFFFDIIKFFPQFKQKFPPGFLVPQYGQNSAFSTSNGKSSSNSVFSAYSCFGSSTIIFGFSFDGCGLFLLSSFDFSLYVTNPIIEIPINNKYNHGGIADQNSLN